MCACARRVAAAQDAPPAVASSSADRAPGETSFLVENVTRAEVWGFFEPPPSGGAEPDYFFVGNRSTLGVDYEGRRWAIRGAIQYVRVENLPRGAIGPGLLGNGGAYYFQAAGTFSYQFYLRALSAAFVSAGRGVTVEAGRLSFTSTDVPSSADPTVGLAQARLDGRLLDDMDGSLYQRAWDGVRVTGRHGDWQWRAAAVLPTQGTFEESANLTLDRVRVVTADVSVAPGALADHTRFRGFAYGYRDTRAVRARPDNSGVTAEAADVTVATFGAAGGRRLPAAGRRVGRGRVDRRPGRATGTASRIGPGRRSPRAASSGPRRPGGRGCAPASPTPPVTATATTTATGPSSRCCRRAIASCGRTPTRS